MDYEIEYKLELFREEQPSLFDENGERYTATPICKETAEMMLQLINEMEKALAQKPDASKNTLPIPHVSGSLPLTEVQELIKEAKDLVVRLLPPIDYGENQYADRLYEILETIEGVK